MNFSDYEIYVDESGDHVFEAAWSLMLTCC